MDHSPLPSAGVRFLEARIRAPSRGRAAIRGAVATQFAHLRAPGILKALVSCAKRRSRRQCGTVFILKKLDFSP